MIDYLQKQPDGDQYLWDVLAGVMSPIDFYQFGFNETTSGVHQMMGDNFCKKATEEANTLLPDRRQPSK